jgi:starch phosphorylase
MRKSMATLTPHFSANRVVREYTEKYYLPAATNYKKRAEDKGALAKKIITAMNDIKNKWQEIHFGETTIGNVEGGYEFKIFIGLNSIRTEQISVELFAEESDGAPNEIKKMETDGNQKEGNYLYSAIVKTKRNASDYTVRLMPNYGGLVTALEDNRILWQR